MAKKAKKPTKSAPKKRGSGSGELSERDVDRAAGGASEITITKVVDKSSTLF